MDRRTLAAVAALVTVIGCRTAQVQSDGPGTVPPPAGAAGAVVPPGTPVTVELTQTISTKDNKVGDGFTARVTEDVRRNGSVVIPKDAEVRGVITGIDGSDRLGDQASLRVAFQSIVIDGRTHAFSADVTDVDVSLADRTNIGDTREKVAVATAAGVAIGAIIGGSLKDALIGGVLGAGAGTIISLGVGDVESALPAGSELTLRTTQSVALR